jgi:hypothetical protein
LFACATFFYASSTFPEEELQPVKNAPAVNVPKAITRIDFFMFFDIYYCVIIILV